MIASASEGGVKNYLAFEALEDGTFTLTIAASVSVSASIQDVSYSIDEGATWVTTPNVDSQQVVITTPTIEAGNRVLWRGNAKKYGSSDQACSKFSSTGEFNVSGNIMSLLYGKDFEDKLTLPAMNTFHRLFDSCGKLLSSEDLLLPATTLTGYCYYFMFSSCTSMTKTVKVLPATILKSSCYYRMYNACPALLEAPELPAETLVSGCYNYMFTNCKKLAKVKAMFLTEPSTSYTNSWLSNVAASGTFVKNAAATWELEGSSGIPAEWTVETASE